MATSLTQKLLAFAGYMFFERPGQKLDYDGHIAALDTSGNQLVATIRGAQDDEPNRTIVRHIIGIEHWSQVRLRELLGAPPFREEYDKYQPPPQHTIAELADIMATTRQQTCAIARTLHHEQIALTETVTHNQFGAMSAAAWLMYMRSHAMLESKKLHK